MTPSQCRAARGLLNWNQDHLAFAAKVSVVTVRNFENEKSIPQRASLDVIRRALEGAGVVFVDEDGWAGVKAQKTLAATPHLSDWPNTKAPKRTWADRRAESLATPQFVAIIFKDPVDGGYLARFPDFDFCSAFASTLRDLPRYALRELRGEIKRMQTRHEKIPEPTPLEILIGRPENAKGIAIRVPPSPGDARLLEWPEADT
jgi:hypothetical protein